MKIGESVYCFYDTEIPIVKGTVVQNEERTPDGFQKVHWSDGGVSYFPLNRIFTDYNKAKNYWTEQYDIEEKQKEIDEYKLYLRLKEKYEN